MPKGKKNNAKYFLLASLLCYFRLLLPFAHLLLLHCYAKLNKKYLQYCVNSGKTTFHPISEKFTACLTIILLPLEPFSRR